LYIKRWLPGGIGPNTLAVGVGKNVKIHQFRVQDFLIATKILLVDFFLVLTNLVMAIFYEFCGLWLFF
jgi:hypothetical protein